MTIYVPYAGEPVTLLQRTLNSLHGYEVTVIDNSYERVLSGVLFPVLTPPVPLTLWQTLWLLCHRGEPFVWTQCDAEFTPDAVSRLVTEVERLGTTPTKWGIVFTLSDILCAVNGPELVKRNVLPDLNLPHYHGDPDWYRRMRLTGLETVQIDNGGVTHAPGGGGHWRYSHPRNVARQCMDSARYYREKWGGDPSQERFTVPWNGK